MKQPKGPIAFYMCNYLSKENRNNKEECNFKMHYIAPECGSEDVQKIQEVLKLKQPQLVLIIT